MMSNPVLVEVMRGDTVESRHRGSACVVDAGGTVVAALGDVVTPVYPRSAVKPLQALALVESGANFSDQELALACASHNGEPEHVQRVQDWLDRMGLGVDDLECGPSVMMAGLTDNPTRAHNNCSGKHAGFLATALHLGEPTAGYIGTAHPVQQRLRKILGDMTDCDLTHAPEGIDGCGIPVLALPLQGMALGMARMTDATFPAAKRITDAMTAHPFLVAGTDRFDTQLMQATDGRVVVKTGAEGVYGAILPGSGLGVALKIDDGAKRAAEVAMAAVLAGLGIWDIPGNLAHPDICNAMGETVGVIRLCLRSDGFLPAAR